MKNMIILLRILAIIPFLTGSLLLYERILPDEVIETSIISKHLVTRTEDGRTESTYRVNFEVLNPNILVSKPSIFLVGLHEKVSRKMYEIINEGDVLFIPIGWWHKVQSLNPSISLSFTNFKAKNDYNHTYPS